jgi:hypothetical protein
MIETIFSDEVSAEKLEQLAARGEQLIEALGMRPPIRCTLSDTRGAKLREFVLGEGIAADEGMYAEEMWRKSDRGVTLTIQDREGRVAEISLVVGKMQ